MINRVTLKQFCYVFAIGPFAVHPTVYSFCFPSIHFSNGTPSNQVRFSGKKKVTFVVDLSFAANKGAASSNNVRES